MLNVASRFMIKELYRDGESISQIAGLSGHNRKPIRGKVNEPLQAERVRKCRDSKLDLFIG